MFDVGRSMFDVHQFLFYDQTGRSRPEAALTPRIKLDHCNYSPQSDAENIRNTLSQRSLRALRSML